MPAPSQMAERPQPASGVNALLPDTVYYRTSGSTCNGSLQAAVDHDADVCEKPVNRPIHEQESAHHQKDQEDYPGQDR